MTQRPVENAVIEKADFTIDHGCLTSYIHLAGDGWGCGFGGYSLDDAPLGGGEERTPSVLGGWWISRILATLEVERWSALPGKIIRCQSEGLGGGIIRIGHPIKNKWFHPKPEIERLLKEKTR